MKGKLKIGIMAFLPLYLVAFACSENPVHISDNTGNDLMLQQSNHEINQKERPETAASPVILMFEKAVVAEGIWEGIVSGDVDGTLRTELRDLKETGMIWHVEFDWIITAEDNSRSFTARLNGTLNNNTGKVVMNGTVISGWLEGAQVHEEGQLVDEEMLGFEGTIQINPATS